MKEAGAALGATPARSMHAVPPAVHALSTSPRGRLSLRSFYSCRYESA